MITKRASAVLSAGAIALAAYVALGGFGGGDPAASSSVSTPASAFVPGTLHPAVLEGLDSRPSGTYFLVGSEAEHDLLVAEQERIAAEREASGGPRHLFLVVVADTPANQYDAWDWYQDAKTEWLLAGATNIRLVDLRASN
jgi:hypothetical protein